MQFYIGAGAKMNKTLYNVKKFLDSFGLSIILFRKEARNMEQVMVNFRMDAALKREMEATCREMGMSLTTAFTIFAKKVTREQRIPFEVSADPFYSESNLRHLRRGVAALNAGEGQEHELIEADT